MNGELIPIAPEVLAILKGAFGKDGVPMPFVKEIFLMSCRAAGTSHNKNIEGVSKDLNNGDLLVFRRESENPHDKLAILILNEKGEKIGYVPREKNEVIARLMDAGKLIFGKVESKEWVEKWLKLGVRTYMRDM